ncbi:pectin/pectate lyase [Trinickia caryophylli]|uniref:pectin lyase n=1 Tax=Trinickia caryophylli TaxID=28094 RepID=A0A1X7FUH7_TRICW|nr:pectin/pectate lyase [Trinickia caryophylli]WQE13872.1 pectin/pectate lyase [Trinickia caryophylli]GLU33579.1 hypothetical protein Busp01_34210 [Trinickia caryophylli]SMF58884.1 pectin lyase [Trinickia caryophylli]
MKQIGNCGSKHLMAMLLVTILAGCGGDNADYATTSAGTAAALSVDPPAESASVDTKAAQPVSISTSAADAEPASEDAATARVSAVATTNTLRGLGGGVTGGGSGKVQHVTTPAGLRQALCSNIVGGICEDDTPRVISVDAMIDFAGTERTGQVSGCYYSMLPGCVARDELALFNPADTHCNGVPKFTLSYDKAGRDNLLVGSNKTLVGKAGGKAGIRGAGLAMLGGVHNIIIRNLTIGYVNDGIIFAGDAVILGNTKDVWLDHNRFSHIGRQMIVSGWEANSAARNVTVSWNDFDGRTNYSPRCDGSHYWNFLLTGQSETFVFAYNWIHQFSGRAPAVHGKNQFVHLMSNYFQDGTYHALEAFATNAVLVEGNYFSNVKIPILQNTGNRGAVYAPLQPLTSQAKADCISALGRSCSRNVVASSGTNDFTADAYVLRRASTLQPSLPSPSAGAASLPGLLPGNVGPK